MSIPRPMSRKTSLNASHLKKSYYANRAETIPSPGMRIKSSRSTGSSIFQTRVLLLPYEDGPDLANCINHNLIKRSDYNPLNE
jgi:hypothetical protein